MGFGLVLTGGKKTSEEASDSKYRTSWTRPEERPGVPDEKWTGVSSALFLVYAKVAKTIDTKACLISSSANAIVVKNRTTDTAGTATSGIDVLEGWNWIEILDTNATWTVLPFDVRAATDSDIVAYELYVKHASASFAPRLPSGAWANVTMDVLISNRACKNTIDYFCFSGIKTSWNYYFAGLQGLKRAEIDGTTATSTFSNAFLLCDDLHDLVLRATSLNLANCGKYCRLANFEAHGTITNMTGAASYSIVSNMTLETLLAAANLTVFAGTDILDFSSGVWNMNGNTLTCSLGSTKIEIAKEIAQEVMGATTKTIILGLANGYSEDIVQYLIGAGWTVTL
jgi:hypothetical protein